VDENPSEDRGLEATLLDDEAFELCLTAEVDRFAEGCGVTVVLLRFDVGGDMLAFLVSCRMIKIKKKWLVVVSMKGQST
jgi:hypothetical protein